MSLFTNDNLPSSLRRPFFVPKKFVFSCLLDCPILCRSWVSSSVRTNYETTLSRHQIHWHYIPSLFSLETHKVLPLDYPYWSFLWWCIFTLNLYVERKSTYLPPFFFFLFFLPSYPFPFPCVTPPPSVRLRVCLNIDSKCRGPSTFIETFTDPSSRSDHHRVHRPFLLLLAETSFCRNKIQSSLWGLLKNFHH